MNVFHFGTIFKSLIFSSGVSFPYLTNKKSIQLMILLDIPKKLHKLVLPRRIPTCYDCITPRRATKIQLSRQFLTWSHFLCALSTGRGPVVMHLQFKSVQGVHDTKIVQTLFPQLPNGLDESLFLCSLETLAHILPVDDVPDGLHVVRPDVFVLQATIR